LSCETRQSFKVVDPISIPSVFSVIIHFHYNWIKLLIRPFLLGGI
jgi:hypothetical protein